MPLTQRVSFKARLQKQNRILVPQLVRWQYKLEPDQILEVTVSPCDYMSVRESFLAKMLKDGRIVIPKLTLQLLQQDGQSLEGQIMEVTLQPV